MRRVTLLDVETTSLSPQDGRCIEVAVQVFDIQLACPIVSYSELIRGDGNAAESVNGIPPAALLDANEPIRVWERVRGITAGSECFAAHRSEFDRQWVPEDIRSQPWVCTKTDFQWPSGRRGDHLVQLALSLGLGVASAHRAMADVDTMSRILTRVADMGGNLEELFRLALRPKKRYVAVRVPFEKNQMLKDHGFLWDSGSKVWYRHMPPEDTGKLPFLVMEKA
jgi:DNA polymerase III subunit epsilon